jgi:polyhydroxyalkanoate synthase subunit PhaC
MDNNSFNRFIKNFFTIIEKYNQIYQELININSNKNKIAYIPMADLYASFTSYFIKNPEKVMQVQSEIFNEHIRITKNVTDKFSGKDVKAIFDSKDHKDKRFADILWEENPIYNYIKQAYFMLAEQTYKIMYDLKIDDQKKLRKMEFLINQLIMALSPSNFILTNPTVLKKTIETQGDNLIKGLDNLLNDLARTQNILDIATTNLNHFELGKNIATTEGNVIYQNQLMQLIEYRPLTKNNFEIPLLIIPPWINKYYVFDLKEESSIIKWLLQQGYKVFIISWVNPDASLSHKNFEHYMLEGPVEAIKVIKKHSNVKQINLMGYCIGGTLVTCTLAYLKQIKELSSISSVTLLTTPIDFEECGDLSIFIDEDNISKVEEVTTNEGYLDGKSMRATFNMLRPNDMIWSNYINNYLLGDEPFPFDILYWNSDSTRLPHSMHSFFIRNMYLNNLLKIPGGITLAGERIDISKLEKPIYILSTIDDHIVPWKSSYKNIKLLNNKNIRFVLSGSGHVAGVINHPHKNKYNFWVNNNLVESADEWLDSSEKQEGSWWHDWHQWKKDYSGEEKSILENKNTEYKAIEQAPGSYVMVK